MRDEVWHLDGIFMLPRPEISAAGRRAALANYEAGYPVLQIDYYDVWLNGRLF